jgi:TRAP-type C4-dicarboxylate transport system permease small subunit
VDGAFRFYLKASEHVVRVVSCTALLAVTAISALEVMMRAFSGTSLPWAQEVSVLAAMWVYFFAYALMAKHYDYLRVEILFGMLPRAVRRVIAPLCRMTVILFFGLVLWFGIGQFGFLSLFRTNVLEVPEYVMIIPMVLGALDIVLTEAIYLFWQLRGDDVPGSAEVSTSVHVL